MAVPPLLQLDRLAGTLKGGAVTSYFTFRYAMYKTTPMITYWRTIRSLLSRYMPGFYADFSSCIKR